MHLLLVLVLFSMVNGDTRNHMIANRTTIVHLFEWKWKDIADECERFLAPKGYGGVQISPPSENLIIHLSDGRRPWYERYQVMSYKLVTRSGNQDEFLDMTRRCNNVGVRIYPDVVINHMTGSPADNRGTGGSTADFDKYYYPGVPYNASHFHNPHCGINDYNNANEVRNCELSGLKDLNQSDEYVRDKIVGFLNQLIKLGVAGFRVDAAKHMWPGDLEAIYKRLDNLEPAFGFPVDARPYIYQEVIYYGGGEPVRPDSYTPLGDVTEFRVGTLLKDAFRGRNQLKYLISWGQQWGLMPSETALTFIDNHDTQRSDDVLTFKEARAYKAAIGFMLAHPYGNPRVMSSFFFGNREQGPPSDDHENILSQSVNGDACSNGWVCEHRWRQIYQMVAFRNAVEKAPIQNWWDNGNKQIAFGRGDRGFVVFNGEFAASLDQTLQTGLPAGEYCDVISGKMVGTQCTGRKITVHNNGFAHFYIPENHEDVHLAIHVGTESRI